MFKRFILSFILIIFWKCSSLVALTSSSDVKINICENVADHIFLRDIDDCSKYFVCINHQAKAQRCKPQFYFDAERQACISSAQGCLKCPTRQMFNLQLHKTCDKFITCYYGQPMLKKCPDSQQFNVKTGKCDLAQNVDCVENHCSIHTYDKELVYVPSIASCEKYFICMAGQAKSLTCAEGLQFSTKCNCCERAENVQCSINRPTLVSGKEKRLVSNYVEDSHSPTLIGESQEIKCPPKGRFLYQYIEDPEYYFTCINGKAVMYACASGFHFDNTLKRCVSKEKMDQDMATNMITDTLDYLEMDEEKNETNLSFKCPELGAKIMPHHESNKYVLCLNGKASEFDCPPEHYFDAEQSICRFGHKLAPSHYGSVLDEFAGIVCPKFATFTFPHAEREKFYLCLDGKAGVFACAQGQYFDAEIHGCREKLIMDEEEDFSFKDLKNIANETQSTDNNNSHQMDVQCPETGNTTLPHVLKTHYYLCVQGKAAVFTCPQGLLYEAKMKTCTIKTPSSFDMIFNPALSSEIGNIRCPKFGTFKFPHKDPSQYYLCTDGKTYILACGQQEVFDAQINICREGNLLELATENESKNHEIPEVEEAVNNLTCPMFGTFIYPHHSEQKRYYVCIDGKAIGFTCAHNEIFDAEAKACRPAFALMEEDDEQMPKVLDEPVNILCPTVGAMKFAHEEKHKFYLCVNGMASVLACAKGSFFESATGACRRFFSEESSSNETFGILNETAVAVKCPLFGTFIYPHEERNRYYVCLEGKAIVMLCPEGLIFDEKDKVCRNTENKELEDIGTFTVVRETVNVMCPAKGVHKFAHAEKQKFYLCINGMGSVLACPKGSNFDVEASKCQKIKNAKEDSFLETKDALEETGDLNSDSITCPKLGTFLYAHQDPGKYYVCMEGSLMEFNCTKEYEVFDSETKTCRQRFENELLLVTQETKKHETTSENKESITDSLETKVTETKISSEHAQDQICPPQGTLLMPHLESNKFYLCLNGLASLQSCASDHFFDNETKTCRETQYNQKIFDNTENIKCPLSGSQKLAHIDPNKFYLCLDGQATTYSCAKGDYFEAVSETCREIMNPNEEPQTLSVDSLCSGPGSFMIAHSEPNKFYSCIEGVAKLESCAEGDYFDKDLGTCREVFGYESQLPMTTLQPLENEDNEVICPAQGIAMLAHSDLNKFYLCVDGVAMLESCEKGKHFDAQTETCDKLSNTGNFNIKCPSFGSYVYPMTERNQYYVCEDGKERLVYCKEGEVFDNEMKSCHKFSMYSEAILEGLEEEVLLQNKSKENDLKIEEFNYKSDEINFDNTIEAENFKHSQILGGLLPTFESTEKLNQENDNLLTSADIVEKKTLQSELEAFPNSEEFSSE